MKIGRTTLYAIAMTMVATPAVAGVATGKITTLRTRATDGLQFVTIQGATSGSPPCVGNNYFMIRDEKSDAGKAQFAMLMAASLSGKSVTVEGAGSCQRWFDGEDIATVMYAQ